MFAPNNLYVIKTMFYITKSIVTIMLMVSPGGYSKIDLSQFQRRQVCNIMLVFLSEGMMHGIPKNTG